MNNFRGVAGIGFALINILLALKYGFSLDDWLLMFFVIGLSASFFRKLNIKNDFFILFFIVYILCCVHIVSLFELHSVGFRKEFIYPNEYRQLAIWGTHLYFILFTVNASIKLFATKAKSQTLIKTGAQVITKKRPNVDSAFKNFAFLVFFIQALTFIFGLSSAYESARVVLPFHLNGIFDELRTQVFTFVFALYIYHKYSHLEKFDRFCIVLFVLYSLIEVFIRSSKGAFVESYLPALVVLVFVGQLSRKNVVRFVIPLFLALALIYPIVESARQEGALTIESVSNVARGKSSVDDEEHSSSFIRTFLTGVYYTKLITVVNSNEFEFDFSHLPQLLALGGGSAYMTRVIDNMPETTHHSSGVTGLCDALLWGGYPMCYIVVAFLVLLGIWGDRGNFFNKKVLYRLILFFWFYDRLKGTTLSYFVDPLLLSTVGSVIIKILIARYYYRKIC